MSALVLNRHFRRLCMIAGVVLLLAAGSLAPYKSKAAGQTTDKSAQRALELALYYYKSDDLDDRAKNLLKDLTSRRYENTPESETAQYYLGAYYQRRYYLCSEKRGDPDWSSLDDGGKAYRAYTDKYYFGGTHKWLNESFFNLAMVKLQQGEPWSALNELSKLKEATARDPAVYIYRIVWSSQSEDVIDANIPAAQLADYASKVIRDYANGFDKHKHFAPVVLLIRKWCQGQRVKALTTN